MVIPNRFRDFVKHFRELYSHISIAGNVVTGEMTEELILSGADIVKVGICPGAFARPIPNWRWLSQLSAVIECADVIGLGGHIIADGGCNNSGDVAKGFAGGVHYAPCLEECLQDMMKEGERNPKRSTNEVTESCFKIGGKEALADTAPTKIEEKQFVEFYGMSSKSANNKHFGGLKDYLCP